MNYRIIQGTKRPKREVLVRRVVMSDGDQGVVVECWGSELHQTEEVVTFETHEAAQFYVDTFSEAAAKQFAQRAAQAAERDAVQAEKELGA